MFCPKCNIDRGPETRFCKDCGTKTVPPGKRCKSNKEDGTLCDAIVEEDASFCSVCGNKIETEKVCDQCNVRLNSEDTECPRCGPSATAVEGKGVATVVVADTSEPSIPSEENIQKDESSTDESDLEFVDAVEELDGEEATSHDSESGGKESSNFVEAQDNSSSDQTSDKPTSDSNPVEDTAGQAQQNGEQEDAMGTSAEMAVPARTLGTCIETNVDSFKQTTIDQIPDNETVYVHFYVLIPANVKFQPDTDYVFLHMWRNHLDGTPQGEMKIPMEYVETHSNANNAVEMKGQILMEMAHVSNSKITYKYFVQRNSKKQNNTKREDFWELCFLQGSEYERRYFPKTRLLNTVKITQGQFHVYDGFLYKPKQLHSLKRSGIIQTMFSSVGLAPKKMVVESHKDADIVIKVFAKQIVSTWSKTVSTSHFVAVMKHMCFELLNGTRIRYMHGKDAGITSQQINQNMWKAFADFYQSLQDSKSKEDRKRKLCILIVMIFIRNNALQQDPQSLQFLASKLLVEVDFHNKRVYEWDILEQNFSKLERDIIRNDLLLLATEIVMHMPKNPMWWYLLPLLHFLSGVCVPFDEVSNDATHAARKPEWWGLKMQDIEKLQKGYKYRNEKKIPVMPFIRKMKDVFHADYYLPRTIVACLDIHEIKDLLEAKELDIPIEVFYAVVAYFISVSKEEELISKCLQGLMYHGQKQDHGTFRTRLWLKAVIAGDMACKAIQAVRLNINHIESCTKLYLLSMARYDNVVVTEADEKEMKTNNTSLKDMGCLVIKRIESFSYKHLEDQMDFWDRMICPSSYVQSGRIQDVWNEQITNALHDRINQLITETPRLKQVLVTLYCKQMNIYQTPMQDVLKTFVTEILKDPTSLETTISSRDTENLRTLMLNTFNEQWDDFEKRYRTMNLEVFCQWRNLHFFLTVLCQNDGKDAPELRNLKFVIDVVENCVDMLISGLIKIKDLRTVSHFKTEFMNIIRFTKYKDNTVVETAVSVRTREHGAVVRILNDLAQVKEFCRPLTLDLTILEKLLITNLEDSRLSDVIVVTPESAFANFDGSAVQLKSFPISDEIHKFIKSIEKYGNSNYFKKAWEEECQEHKDTEKFTLENVYHEVVVPVLDRLEEMSETINSRTITFQEIEERIGYLYEKNYDKMQAELATVCSESQQMDAGFLVTQLKNYRKLELMKEVALTLLDISCVYRLNGDFKLIVEISKASVGELQIKESINSLVEACPELQNVTKKQNDCLKAFVDCHDLVIWLREAMKDTTPKERRVFVDIATITAGENVEQASRVQSFEAAVLAYSSLIFDLDTSGDFHHLLRMCENVWKEQENIEGLSEKLLHVNSHLPWFKYIKKTHGAVEMTSLMQAETINDCGKYTIGKSDVQNTATRDIDMESVLILRVPVSQDGAREKREYKLSELQDLQSRLLLVGGEKEQNKLSIDRFTTIFDGAIRLCKIYIELVSSGCVLFKNFSVQVYCNPRPDRPVCVVLEFQNGDSVTQLKCHKSEEELVENIMPKVATSMEKCLSEWLVYVSKSRTEHIHLNFFTTNQLVILQREIAKVCTDGSPSDTVFPLLQILKRHCTIGDINNALESANEQFRKEECSTNGMEDGVPASDAKGDSYKRNVFIQKLSTAKQKDMIPLALDHFQDDYDFGKAIAWCMKHRARKAELEAALAQKQAETMSEQISGETMKSASFITDSNAIVCDQMLAKLNLIWSKFIQSASSNLRDYISLRHLGIFLRELAKDETVHIRRKFPPNYEETFPNLIVCPSHTVLQTTLSLYMTEENQPLPQADEVLMCTSQTTLDEIDIFLRRAIFSSNGKIHCLVNADLLGYTECEGVDKTLTEHLRNRDTSGCFRLVIICTSENEHTSSIVSALDCYRREPVKLKIERVTEYIADNLKEYDAKAASCTDFERSTVRVIRSKRSGMGKTLYKIRKEEQLQHILNVKTPLSVTLTLHGKDIDIDSIVTRLLPHTRRPGMTDPRIIHIDVSNEVYARQGLDYLLFNLLILGSISDSTGYVWRKNPSDLYLIERLTPENYDMVSDYTCQVLKMLPHTTCLSPLESIDMYKQQRYKGDYPDDQLFDQKLFEGEEYQMPYNYLRQLDRGVMRINTKIKATSSSKREVLETLLRHCQIKDPSWSELYYFVHFLHTQLIDFEKNIFFSPELASELPGFSIFVLKFLIQMSKDFSSRSLSISEETDKVTEEEDTCLSAYKMKRTWESSPHPYIFFNADRTTFTFLGFFIDPNTFDLIDQQTNTVLEERVMSYCLHEALLTNGVPIEENFDQLDRMEKMERICRVMDMPLPDQDPDETYELTADNAKKIMAIYMRFRCNIPVIVMGETGCGKTRLVKFMCDLMQTRKDESPNMIIMRVHGGTTENDIKEKVREAEKIAIHNREQYGEQKKNGNSSKQNIYTVLFFDEANTTESIGLIKEIMCDKTMDGESLSLCENLKFVAACNPYRRHPKKLIEKLEKAGLGYHVHANETTDRLGRIAMRRLVYRVQPLPPSLLPFVWDFGQLSETVEKLYIRQMVKRYVRQHALPDDQQLVEVITTILGRSQEYMRRVEDECSFVSLRDVDRVLQVMCWFLSLSQQNTVWFDLLDKKLEEKRGSKKEYEKSRLDPITRSLVLALGVCYHACLSNKDAYRKFISQHFREPCNLSLDSDQIMDELDSCQEVILDKVTLEKNIARNQALKENIFMMVVCIELRIPLFLVGKPGSSKSLAKVIVTDAMQGNASTEPLFKELKQVQMLSFQCSPISTPQGIVSTFRSCAMFQRGKKLSNFVSAVVLDEIGLAEDSPRMPLKTLHPLLEVGCEGEDILPEERKVAFIGISNWALDPAKMNRGIFVQREIPDSKELETTAKGICSTSMKIPDIHPKLIQPLAVAYLKVFEMSVMSKAKREFFGLRDFYCLMKTINEFIEKFERLPTYSELMFAVLRNFSGLEFDEYVEENITDVFMKEIRYVKRPQQSRVDDENYDLPVLIESCLKDPASRHLLLLTENYNALATFQQKILKTSIPHTIIFGSSFRRDQEYTQVCRNISRVKLCMETGKTVILLNSENLYESLYDALNQYYVRLGGQKFVDLGLGSHRVKCRVHKDFKLIIVAEKQLVYNTFPIPLINRLEKHILTSNTMLSNAQNDVAETIKVWAENFAKATLCLRNQATEKDIGKVFIGYHEDACSAIVVDISDDTTEQSNKVQVIQQAREKLLWCATPDAVVRLSTTTLIESTKLQETYWQKQAHDSITQYLEYQMKTKKCEKLFAQVTTHGKLLVSSSHKYILNVATGIPMERILLLESLTAFDTEQQFNNKIREYLDHSTGDTTLLIVQCENGDANANLIACARNSVLDEYEKYKRRIYHKMKHDEYEQQKEALQAHVHVLFIIQMPTTTNGNFKSIQCGDWHSAHIDHLVSGRKIMPSVVDMQGKSVATLMQEAIDSTFGDPRRKEDLEIEEENKEKPKSVIDLKRILSECVHGSMSRVKDTGETGYRTTKRISLLLRLLQEDTSNDSQSFLKEISIKLTRILQDKDGISHQPASSNWIAKKAASLDVIAKTGTLRLACLQTFKTMISPILSGIIAFLDTNQNLNILQKEPSTWQYRAWLSILEADGAFSLSYTDMFPDGDIDSQRDFVVNGTGVKGLSFPSCMPFSWLIREKIDEIITCRPEHYDSTEDENNYDPWSIFEEAPVGKALKCVLPTENDDMIDCYIQDYLHMVYPFEKDTELKVVAEYLKQNVKVQVEGRPTNLMDVHTTYAKIEHQLKYFRDINHVWEQCSNVLIERKDTLNSIGSTDITIQALYLMVEDISTNTKTKCDLTTSDGRRAWLDGVHRCRHIVQQTLGYYLTDTMITEPDSSLLRIRSMWNRVVLLQLFLEDVCTGNDADSITVDISIALWEMMSDDDDMKNIETIDKLDTFLEACYNSAQTEYNQTAEKCSNCESALHHQKKVLPCMHSVCMQCLQELLSQDNQKCFTCKSQLPDGWENIDDASDTHVVDKLQDYNRRCNTFYMNVVSQLCFSENQAPSDDVVDRLMNYPFQCTGLESSEIPTGVDPDVAFKAFILKLLIRTSKRKLHEQLEKHFDTMQLRHDTDHELLHQRSNLVFLVICCLEDNFMEKEQELDIESARKRLNKSQRLLIGQQSMVEKVYGMANARIALAIVAKYIHSIVTKPDSFKEQEDTSLEEMLKEAENLCKLYWPWKYLVQQVYKRYGMDTLLTACRTENAAINWIYREREMKSLNGRVDMYLCCGDEYVQIRQDILDLINGSESPAFVINILVVKVKEIVSLRPEKVDPQITQKERTSPYTGVLVELALHREVTIPLQRNENKLSDEDLQRLNGCEELQDANFSQLLIANDLKGHPFEIHPDESELYTTLKCLIFHWYRVLSTIEIPKAPSVLKPLLILATEPELMEVALLPTMPQDDIADIREMLINTPVEYEDYFGEVPKLYECPNGHPYQVRDCGQPMYVAKCLCGKAIGGQQHQLLEDNRPDSGGDRTSTGHILGDANDREDGPFPERALSRLYCACVRFILHLTMCAGCSNNSKVTAKLIKPAVSESDVISFLMRHLCKDLEDMQTVLSCNTDDVMLLMHYLADTIMKMEDKDTDVSDDEQDDDDIPWTTKEERQQWEVSFSKFILEPVLEESQSILESTNAKFQGTNCLVQMLSDSKESECDETSVENIDQNAKFWIFRTPITLKHFWQTFERTFSSDKSQEEHPLLGAFLENMSILQAVRFIPSILKLHRSLFRKYRHKLYRKEATQITIQKLRSDRLADQDTDRLLDDTITAWNIVRKQLKNHVCNTEFGRIVVPKEITEIQMTEDTPICVLLPTTEDDGICTFAMLDMLIKHQNDLLDSYARIFGRDSNTKVRIPTVLPNDITSAHLVSFDPQTDLQSMILANSTWHLDDGTVEYNFRGFERQLVDRFISSKSRIAFNKSLQIEQMVYRTDMKDADSLKRLERVIAQEKMDGRKAAQICSDINTVPALCQTLSILDISISFLNVTGGEPTTYLNDYLVKTLKMDTDELILKISKSCQLKYIHSLWMYMSMKKSRLMVEDGNTSEAVFDIVPKEYHAPLPDEMQHVYERFLYGLKDEALSELLDVMFRYIILRLTKRDNDSDSPDEAKYPLKYCLLDITDNAVNDGFPEDLRAEHTVLSWFSVAKVVGERKL